MKHGYSNSVKNSLMGRSAKIEPSINAEDLDTSISEKEQPETASDVLSENKDLALAKETISSSETKSAIPVVQPMSPEDSKKESSSRLPYLMICTLSSLHWQIKKGFH